MTTETRYTPGELIVVPAAIAGPRTVAPLRMLVDTGAWMTTITPNVLDLAGYHPRDGLRQTRVRSAIGQEHGYELVLSTFTALGFVKNRLHVHAFDLGHDDLIDGLIGMNFLNDFNLEIMPAEGRIVLEQIAG